ncbi:MAG TPA: hypothetical protein VG448_05695 [Solirubrobacterales bacterium]|nr:hypothetical protein [Solirubrobacterales bacterium]
MRNLKRLSLAVVAAAFALMMFAGAGTASASVLCSVQQAECPTANQWPAGTVLDFSLKAGTSGKLTTTAGEIIDTCTGSTLKGTIENAGNSTTAVTGSLGTMTWTGCAFETTTLLPGKLQITNIAGTPNGTVIGDTETRVTVNSFFGDCIYGAVAGTDLGTLVEGKPATYVANEVIKKLSGSGALCPETAKWIAEYTLTEPKEKTLAVEPKLAPVSPGKSVFCTVQESPCLTTNVWGVGTPLNFSLKAGTSAGLVTTTGEALDTCTGSTVKGKVDQNLNVAGPIESLTWTGCTFPTTTQVLGRLEVTATGLHTGKVKGTSETRVNVNGGFFGSCNYGAVAGTELGELKEGKPATFVANAVVVKLAGSAVACPETAKWTGEYTLTEPKEKTLSVEVGTRSPGSVFCTVQESTCAAANKWAAGTALNFSLKSGTSANLVTTAGEALDTCTGSTVKGKIEKNEPVVGPIESLTWTGCTFPTTTQVLGRLEVKAIEGSPNGTVKGTSETRVNINGGFFGSCNYGAVAGTTLGTLIEGKPATFFANAVVVKLSGSAVACPETAKWTGEYTLTEPAEKTLAVETG